MEKTKIRKLFFWVSFIQWIVGFICFAVSYKEIHGKCTKKCTSETVLSCHYDGDDNDYFSDCLPNYEEEDPRANCTTPGYWDHVDHYCSMKGHGNPERCKSFSSQPPTCKEYCTDECGRLILFIIVAVMMVLDQPLYPGVEELNLFIFSLLSTYGRLMLHAKLFAPTFEKVLLYVMAGTAGLTILTYVIIVPLIDDSANSVNSYYMILQMSKIAISIMGTTELVIGLSNGTLRESLGALFAFEFEDMKATAVSVVTVITACFTQVIPFLLKQCFSKCNGN